MRTVKFICLMVLAVICGSGAFADGFRIRGLKLNRQNGIYEKGEEVVVTGTLLKSGKPAPEYKLRVLTKWESVKTLATDDFPCDGKPFRVSFRGDKPGWVYFAFQVVGPDGGIVKLPAGKPVQELKKELVDEIGAMISPEELRPADEVPPDFEEFWKNERAKLDAVPLNPRLEKIDSGRKGVDLYTVKVDAGLEFPVTGYLAIPTGATEKSLPIYLTFLDGVLGDAYRNAAMNMAERGAVALITTWHGFDVGHPKKYYSEIGGNIQAWKTAERGRDEFYYRKVFVRAMRAADYLKTRPEWNGKDFLVGGGSLAGAQVAAVAALDPQVTLAFIHTPSNCGYNADLGGRKRALPFHWITDSWMTPEMRKAVPYSDIAHLAKFIRCECYFCTGFADEICTPTNVYTAFNNVPPGVKKFITTNPHTGHYGTSVDTKGRLRMWEFFKK